MAANKLQQTLDDFRQQLASGEEAFQRWQSESLRLQAEVSHRLEKLNHRLSTPAHRRQLLLLSNDSGSV